MKHLFYLLLATTCYCASATSYAPSPLMEYFQKYRGSWQATKKEGGHTWHCSTEANFTHIFRVFVISEGCSDGMIDFGSSVNISDQYPEETCHAVLYGGGSARYSAYYFGKPDPKSHILIMESLFPDLKQDKYLIIDFSECPKAPPTFRTSDKPPKKR